MTDAPKKKGESHVRAIVGCFSMDRHVHATEYDELIAFCKSNGYYYAVKAEDTNCITEMGWDKKVDENLLGKVHVHFLLIREKLEHQPHPKDTRYGAVKMSHLKGKCLRECPSLAQALADSRHARSYALLMQKMTSDHAVPYYNKESVMQVFNLPPDLCVLREYISLKEERKFNPEDDAHVAAYKDAGYPVPATMQSVWDYLTTRWYEKNNSKRVKMETLQVQATKNLFHAINATKPELPKALRGYDNDTGSSSAPPAKKAKRLCPRCDPADGAQELRPREQFCDMCKDY